MLLNEPKQSDYLKKVTGKFFHLYFGPYKISKVFGNNAYELVNAGNNLEVKGIFNQCNLKRYIERFPQES